MAPSPENDNAPKAPDKAAKPKSEAVAGAPDAKTQDSHLAVACDNKESSVSKLDDQELKALLDEAISYKIPKDRVGKSTLFQNLLDKAEEDDRKARATSASGSESVRYYNSSATHRTRRRREPSSISENLTHGGSLNNLAKEELYAVAHHLNRPVKTVSTRQRQGGSLPCNVNAGLTPSYDKQFFEEERQKIGKNKKAEYTAIDMESQSLLEHDSLSQDYNEQPEIEVAQTRLPRMPIKYTSKLNLEIGGGGGNDVDESVTVSTLERTMDKNLDNEVSYKALETITTTQHYTGPHYSLLMPGPIWPFGRKSVEDKKVDENGNALGQNASDAKKNKKKKIQTDKNVVVLEAKDVAGHRSDIINDLDKLMEYIGGNEDAGTKKTHVHKAKLHKTHFDEKGKKQRTRKGKNEKLQKSNSLDDISTATMNDFTFGQDDTKVPLRGTKSNADRPRERRSWGNSESLPLHASAENLENSDFRVVTKKKKSKKRRNSVSSARKTYSRDAQNELTRVASPEPRRKSACSVPHSDKSDSSDEDSVHSLPITDCLNIDTDRLNSGSLPISYADIAKNSNALDRPKWNRPPSERRRDKSEEDKPKGKTVATQSVQTSPQLQNYNETVEAKVTEVSGVAVPDIQNWPAIQNNHKAAVTTTRNRPVHPPNNFRNNIKSIHKDKIYQPNSHIHVEQILHGSEQLCMSAPLPHDIPDVQTIEQMHFKQLQMHNPAYENHVNHVAGFPQAFRRETQCATEPAHADCDGERTSSRPAVVILSGDNKEVSGITFGFDINEQLLSDDVCDVFATRFYVPDVFQNHNHDKIVNFIGLAWEDTINQVNGKVKYFSDQL